ncbi:MAG TPA: Ig-like domain-containing protein, partial [Gemmatimonadales bacterium]|nr:Ig-like domain-containing protein [Gemmatimonadales bacterium]
MLRNLILTLPILGLLSCEWPQARGTGPETGPLARLEISPPSTMVRVNQTRDITVVGFTAASDTAEIAITFEVRGSAGGSLTGTSNPGRGRAVGHYRAGNGSGRDTVIVVDTSGVADSALVDVTVMPVSSVTVTPPAALLRLGGSATFTATTRDSTGAVLSGRAITWASTNSGVASVDAGGAVSAAAVGTASIIASSEGLSDTAVVTVTLVPVATVTVAPPSATILRGTTTPFTATLRDSAGGVLTGRSISWSSTNTAVATVNSSGVATGVSVGSASIIVTSEGKADTASLTVVNVPVASVTVSPTSATIGVGATQSFTATMRDSAGGLLTGRVVTWRSTATGVATVNASGVATGVAAGSTSIIATSEGQADTASLTVIVVPVASVTLTPVSATIFITGTRQFTATLRDSAGGLLTGRVVTWSSTATGVATVNASGLATGVAAGSASIIATSEGKADTSALTVIQVPVASVTVTPASATISVGATRAFTATLRDSAGGTLTGRVVTWSSTATGVATVNASGVATAVSAGSASIIATSEGKADTAAVTVPAPVASVTISPASATIAIGGTRTFTATLRDSAGGVLTGRVVTWSSTATGVATVNASGVATGVAVGSTSIIATSEGKADTATLNVIVVPVASVTVTPASASVAVGATTSFSATTRDSAGGLLTGRVITWASTAPAVATVGPTGVATGVSAGSASIIATSEGKADTAALTVTAAPPPGALADPTLLPRATGQHPASGTYGRNLAAGQTYVDPNSGATVLKLTSASVPASNGGMYHGYSEGGPNISQPWTGTDGLIYYTAKVGDWLVDIRYSTFTSLNWRRVNYSGEIGFAFSLNPATPRIAYLANGKRIDRYNTGTNALENTGNWPWNIAAAGTSADWLQSQMNDTWIVAMLQSNHTIVAFRPSDGFERAISEAAAGVSIDEPHLDREFPYVYLSTNSSVQNKIVNLQTGAFRNPPDPQGINGDDHASPMRGKVVALTWTANGFIKVDTAGNVSKTGAVDPSPTDWGGDWHQASQWVFNNPNEYFVVDQWADVGAYPIFRGMFGFVSLAGDIR